ncbi:MAG TPA: glycosyltransferase family 39 protein [Candidatus Sulfotelmatobacter sp.]|jgi:4-amino-4-deoxy-L-arabinose transferase-like glycosyltransferase|nr:glycosyltransferase family 39 protein [Candidatus Sulfotelmatobacter sp.]
MTELLKFDPISRKVTWLLIFLLFIISASLTLINVAHVPPGLYQDESAIGYNAYSILKTGKDEYGNSHPLYFKSFGDYKLPVYIYTTALSIKLFGLNEFAVRFPSILAGVFSVIILFFFVQYLTKNTTLSFLSALAFALNPTHLIFSRAGFEVNIALAFALTGCYLFVLAVTKKKFLFIVFSLLCFGLSLYSYNVTRLISPLFFAGLVALYWKQVRSFSKIHKISAVIVSLLILSPFLMEFFAPSGVLSAKSTLITSTDVLAKDLEFRSYLVSLPHIYTALFYNQYFYMIFQYLQNLATIFSGSFYFVSGTSQLNQGIGDVGYFYLFDLPFFVVGLIIYYRIKFKAFRIFNLWLITAIFVLALSKDVPQATRGYFIVLPTICFIAFGIFFFFYYLSIHKNKIVKYLLLAIFIVFVFSDIQYYFLSYYFRFPLVYASAWRKQDKDLTFYLKAHESKYSKIIIDSSTDFIYTTYLFYSAYSPSEFVASAKRYKDGDLIKANAWGKYQIKNMQWDKDLMSPHTLIVSTQADVPKNAIILGKMYDPTTFNTFSINGKIVNAPQNNVKYMLIETDANKNNKMLLKQFE